MKVLRFIVLTLISGVLLASNGCLPSQSEDSSNKQTITLYGFSIMKEVMEKEIFPAFAAKWKAEHGTTVEFVSSFAGSETVTNQILQGTPADVAILSIDRDAQRLFEGKATTTDWHAWPNKGIINKTPFVILVRKGNPRGIKDFADLGKPGVKVIHPDPVSSGGAQWSLLAIYGSELKKSEAEGGTPDKIRALNTLKAIWANVISTPGSAREARTQFETGYGDALITYELEGLMMKQAGADIDMIVPRSTIFSEHPVVVIDRSMTDAKRPIAQAFIQYLWTDEAQKAFVKYHFRSVTNDGLNDAHSEFAKIELPFAVDMFGGWDKAYPDVIEGIFRNQVQNKR
ncbi:MAG TPA: sulfate ABC transporter substrate-binding protein [Pyrinomonadaceae bacterium]|jgi:sulfate transport system substrate-binding protein|nr:sulfate ABC transporter substrate-binding protein [Pyrinomonadaceae bacterium]